MKAGLISCPHSGTHAASFSKHAFMTSYKSLKSTAVIVERDSFPAMEIRNQVYTQQ